MTNEARLREIARKISPVSHVSADDAPTLLIHGDADTLVPIQQSQTLVEKLQGPGSRPSSSSSPAPATAGPT